MQDDGKWSKHVENCTKRQIEPRHFLYVDILVGARNPLKIHYTQPWLDLTWNMHMENGTLISKMDINKLENIQRKASRCVKNTDANMID